MNNKENNFVSIENGSINFRFDAVDPDCHMSLSFKRTLRIPDDNKKYGLPPSLGNFPLHQVDDFAEKLPETWKEHGGAFFPMYQSEAMWIAFDRSTGWPFAVKIAAGKINAISGKPWKNELSFGKEDKQQDYAVLPKQPWIDGFCASKGVIKQFVAMPLGKGYTAEEQLTDQAEHGGIQIIAYPMKKEAWERIKPKFSRLMASSASSKSFGMQISASSASSRGILRSQGMGLAAGGMMEQQIYEDPYKPEDWDTENYLRCFVHLVNSQDYEAVTGKAPPHKAFNQEFYRGYGYTWYSYYDDGALEGSKDLASLQSVASLETQKGENVIDNALGGKPNKPLLDIGPKKKGIKDGKW